MSFDLVAYEPLKARIIESVKTLILDHEPEHKIDLNKLEESIKKVLNGERKVQALLLIRTLKILDKCSDQREQALVLNSLAFNIRDQIGSTYKWVSPERSNLFKSLTIALDLNKENDPGSNDLVDMNASLKKFLCDNVYTRGDARFGYLVKQPFAIKGYTVENHIDELSEKVTALEKEIRAAARALRQEQLKPAQASSSLLGSWWGGGSSSASKPGKDAKHTPQDAVVEQSVPTI